MPDDSTEVKDAEQQDAEQTRGSSHCSSAWSFLWTDYADERYPDGDYDSKLFEGMSFVDACDAMVAWMEHEFDAVEPVVDYEARAEHLMDSYDANDHARFFPRLDMHNHRIKDYVK